MSVLRPIPVGWHAPMLGLFRHNREGGGERKRERKGMGGGGGRMGGREREKADRAWPNTA